MPTTNSGPNVTQLREESGEDTYRIPPHNIEAEQALLGAILVNNRAYEAVGEFLQPDHFFDPAHGRIFAAAAKLIERGQIANPVTLKNYFEQDGDLAAIGGAQYLARLAGAAVTIINAHDYGQTIHDLHLRRQLIALGEDVVNEAYSHDLDVTARHQIEETEKRLFDLATTGEYEGGFRSFETSLTSAIQMAEAAYKREGRLTGVSTGLIDLDKLLGGLHRSDLIVLAGRPSMGKTALATNIAFHAARTYREEHDEAGHLEFHDGAVAGFFSLEMSAEQLATRVLAEESNVSSEKIRRGELSTDDFHRVVEASQELSRVPLFIDDTPALTVAAMRTRARRLKRQHGLELIIVDYLQLLQPSMRVRNDNRVQEISEITRGLKALAKDLDVPVLALSQLSRAVEQREDKRPQLADLRESGSIEQDADVVMFVFREEYYLARREPPEGTDKHDEWRMEMDKVHNLAEVIVAKQRHGPIGKVKLHFDGPTTKFDNYAPLDHLPDAFA